VISAYFLSAIMVQTPEAVELVVLVKVCDAVDAQASQACMLRHQRLVPNTSHCQPMSLPHWDTISCLIQNIEM
jgi:hypothetical protein